jgi:hypothetical protein
MALAARGWRLFDEGGCSVARGGAHMKRVLFVLFGISMALTVFGLVFAFTRPIKWPATIRPLDWWRATEPVGNPVEVEEVGA